MQSRKQFNGSTFDRCHFAALILLEILLSFTFLGYIHLPLITVTTAYIPVLLAGCLLGPMQATVLGFVFGLTSMYKASASYVIYADIIFSPFVSGNPVGSIILSIGSRTLFGFLTGIAFYFAKKTSRPRLFIGIISALGAAAQGFIVLAALFVTFPDMAHEYLAVYRFGPNDVLLAAVNVIICESAYAVSLHPGVKKLKHGIDRYDSYPSVGSQKRKLFAASSLLLLAVTFSAAFYFANRTLYMLGKHGVAVSVTMFSDLIHLQIQFLAATLSVITIILMLLVVGYRYMTYKEYIGELDSLTDVMGRRMFLRLCEKLLGEARGDSQGGWFLFIDVDCFKEINDTLGHPVGDMVLRKIAEALKEAFSDCGSIGRVGGDEFAAITDSNLPQSELEKRLDVFLESISHLLPNERRVSCSIGVCHFEPPVDMTSLIAATDRFLYEAKKRGKACYVIGEHAPAAEADRA